MSLNVLGAKVSLGGQEHLDVLAGSVENAGKVGGSHDCGCLCVACLDENCAIVGWVVVGGIDKVRDTRAWSWRISKRQKCG